MRITIDRHPYTVGLKWQIAASEDEVQARMEESGAELGVVLKQGKAIVGVGFAEDEGRNPPPSAAAMLALHYPADTLCVVEWADLGRDRQFWMVAISGGAVVSGTDIVVEDASFLRRQVQELVKDFGCRVAGSASMGFLGDGEGALSAANSPKTRSAASIKSLTSGASSFQVLLLAALLLGVLAAGWLLLQPDQPQAPAEPVIDRQAEQRKQAIAERNRLLAQDLSGFGAYGLSKLARGAAKQMERSAALWKLSRKSCDQSACSLTWQAMSPGAMPEQLANALGISRERVLSDTRAQTVTVTEALGAQPTRVEASESTPLTGRIQPLIDRCRRFGGMGGTCNLDAAQPASLPNAQLLPPGLQYHRGRLSLAVRIGSLDSLIPVFDTEALSPWVRADSIELDYDTLELRLEGHYVIP